MDLFRRKSKPDVIVNQYFCHVEFDIVNYYILKCWTSRNACKLDRPLRPRDEMDDVIVNYYCYVLEGLTSPAEKAREDGTALTDRTFFPTSRPRRRHTDDLWYDGINHAGDKTDTFPQHPW